MEAETDTKDLATTTPVHIFLQILSKNLKQTNWTTKLSKNG